MLCMCPDRRPAFGSCREGVCCVCVPTGDLLSVLDIIYIHFYIIIMCNVRNKSCFCRDFTFL